MMQTHYRTAAEWLEAFALMQREAEAKRRQRAITTRVVKPREAPLVRKDITGSDLLHTKPRPIYQLADTTPRPIGRKSWR